MIIHELVIQIENNLLDSNTDLVECLKKTRQVAKFFNDIEILEWIENELKGYKSDKGFPEYRRIQASFYQTKVEVNLWAGYRRTSKDILETFPYRYTENIEEVIKKSEEDVVHYTVFVKDLKANIIIKGPDLKTILMEVNLKLSDYIQEKSELISKLPYETPLMKIFNKFHIIAEQLKTRYNDRSTLIIENEYDVQDLLNALLYLEFDSIQKEEYGPKFGNINPRIDFLLRMENIGIEAKKVREINHAKTIHKEIIEDKELYSNNRQISELYFFIYDPEFYIKERVSFISDLEKNVPKQFNKLKIIIKPEFK